MSSVPTSIIYSLTCNFLSCKLLYLSSPTYQCHLYCWKYAFISANLQFICFWQEEECMYMIHLLQYIIFNSICVSLQNVLVMILLKTYSSILYLVNIPCLTRRKYSHANFFLNLILKSSKLLQMPLYHYYIMV